jgi:hypothetical protein
MAKAVVSVSVCHCLAVGPSTSSLIVQVDHEHIRHKVNHAAVFGIDALYARAT